MRHCRSSSSRGTGPAAAGPGRRQVVRLLALAALSALGAAGPCGRLRSRRFQRSPCDSTYYRIIRRRRMVRVFQEENLPEARLERLFDAAVRAPSAGNLQPWEFIVVREPKRRRALARAALGQMWVASAPAVIVACANQKRAASRYGRRGAEFYSLIDTAFASLLLLLAVTAEGLGACFVGAFEDARVKRIIGLPAHVKPVGIIPVGFRAEERPRGGRRGRLRRRFYLERYGKLAR